MWIAPAACGAFSPFFKYVDIAQSISEVMNQMKIFTSGKGIALNYTSHLQPHTLLLCDIGMLERALCNLLSNAVKAVPSEGGKIDVNLDCDEKNVYLTVRDNGRGIKEEYKDKLFEIYWHDGNEYHSPSESTGLGLYITRAVAAAHGGDVTVNSKQGDGAEFCMRISRTCSEKDMQNMLNNPRHEYNASNTEFTVLTEMSDLI